MALESGKRFECNECDKAFTNGTNFNSHVAIHREDPPHKGTVCGKGYFHVYQHKEHDFSHILEKFFLCTICNRTFKGKSKLHAHYDIIHNEGKPFKLKVHGKEYPISGLGSEFSDNVILNPRNGLENSSVGGKSLPKIDARSKQLGASGTFSRVHSTEAPQISSNAGRRGYGSEFPHDVTLNSQSSLKNFYVDEKPPHNIEPIGVPEYSPGIHFTAAPLQINSNEGRSTFTMMVERDQEFQSNKALRLSSPSMSVGGDERMEGRISEEGLPLHNISRNSALHPWPEESVKNFDLTSFWDWYLDKIDAMSSEGENVSVVGKSLNNIEPMINQAGVTETFSGVHSTAAPRIDSEFSNDVNECGQEFQYNNVFMSSLLPTDPDKRIEGGTCEEALLPSVDISGNNALQPATERPIENSNRLPIWRPYAEVDLFSESENPYVVEKPLPKIEPITRQIGDNETFSGFNSTGAPPISSNDDRSVFRSESSNDVTERGQEFQYNKVLVSSELPTNPDKRAEGRTCEEALFSSGDIFGNNALYPASEAPIVNSNPRSFWMPYPEVDLFSESENPYVVEKPLPEIEPMIRQIGVNETFSGFNSTGAPPISSNDDRSVFGIEFPNDIIESGQELRSNKTSRLSSLHIDRDKGIQGRSREELFLSTQDISKNNALNARPVRNSNILSFWDLHPEMDTMPSEGELHSL